MEFLPNLDDLRHVLRVIKVALFTVVVLIGIGTWMLA